MAGLINVYFSALMLAQSEVTPSSNTGLECQNKDASLEASIDYFQGTAVFATLERLREAAEFAICFNSDEPINWMPGTPMFAGIMWESSGSSFDGSRLAYSPLKDGGYKLWLSLPGGYFHSRDTRDAALMLSGLKYAYGFKCTRIDLKVRDYSRRKSPYDIYEQFRLGNIARVRQHEWISSGTVDSTSDTLYLGSRKSEKFLRIYDAQKNHDISAIDWELQCRDEKANYMFTMVADIFNSELDNHSERADILTSVIGSTVCGAIDIVYNNPEKRLSRMDKQEWWVQFCNECGGQIRISIPKKSISLQKTLDWLDKQVFVVISALRRGFGKGNFNAWLQSRLDDSERRFTPMHEGLIHLCINNRSVYVQDYSAG